MKKYRKGDIVSGCVTGIEKYGIFLSLDDYYNGLIHISEISEDFVKNIHDYVRIGETINAKVLEENEKEHHVKLSIKGVDYRKSRIIKQQIKETENGFLTLKYKLDYWINEKIEILNSEEAQKK